MSAQAVSRWRARRRELMASAPVRSPLAAAAAARSKLVGDLGHGADHDDSLLAGGHAARDDGGGAVDGGRVFHRGAAEFHHDQAHAFLVPTSGAKSPAFLQG